MPHKTTDHSYEDLLELIESTKKADERVLLIFKRKGVHLTPRQVHAAYQAWFSNILLTSIRRSISDLTKRGILCKVMITYYPDPKTGTGKFQKPMTTTNGLGGVEHFWTIDNGMEF